MRRPFVDDAAIFPSQASLATNEGAPEFRGGFGRPKPYNREAVAYRIQYTLEHSIRHIQTFNLRMNAPDDSELKKMYKELYGFFVSLLATLGIYVGHQYNTRNKPSFKEVVAAAYEQVNNHLEHDFSGYVDKLKSAQEEIFERLKQDMQTYDRTVYGDMRHIARRLWELREEPGMLALRMRCFKVMGDDIRNLKLRSEEYKETMAAEDGYESDATEIWLPDFE